MSIPVTGSPPRARPIQYQARHGTRWEKEKAAAGKAAFDFPEDPTSVGPWIIGECVGKGASGRVKVARHSITGQLAAVKILPLEALLSSRLSLDTKTMKLEKHRNGIDKEIVMMKLMDHPNIIRIYDVYEGVRELYLILEYVEGGELFDYLVNHGRMEPLKGLCYFKQIIYGLSYAHAFSIIHRDLKPENILIQSLNPPRIKIADWGMAAFAPPAHQLETSCGSPHYASPEIVNGKRYEGAATDIWSCGVILYALMTGRLPFDDKDMKLLLRKVKSGKYEIPSYVDPKAADLIQRILVVDVEKRITMLEILAHPFLQQPTPGTIYIPAPSITELARPLRSQSLIKPDLLRSLQVIWGQATNEEMVAGLMSPPGHGCLVKALYFLLVKYREKTLEEYGMSNLTVSGNGCNIKHYLAPPPKNKIKTGPSGPDASSAKSALSSQVKVTPTAPRLLADLTAPLVPQLPTNAEPCSSDKTSISRQRPRSPLGPREPHATIPAEPVVLTNASKQKTRPLSTPNASAVNAAAAAHPLVPAPARIKPRRALTTADGLPSSLRSPHDGYDFRPVPSVPSSPLPPIHMTQSPLEMLKSPVLSPCSPRVEQAARFEYFSNEPASLPWPAMEPLQPPRVGDPVLQRTMDDMAGRFNQYVQQTANGNANTSMDDSRRPDPEQLYMEALMHMQARGKPSSRSDNRPSMSQFQGSVDDKENRPVEGKRYGANDARPASTDTLGRMLMGNGQMGHYKHEATKAGKKMQRKGRPPALDMQYAKRSTLLGIASPNGPMSPPLITGSSLLSPPVVEFKGWFSNLFNWKAQQYTLHSVDNCSTTREETALLLRRFGVEVVQEDMYGWEMLRCKMDESYDSISGVVVQKPVRFRVEFTPVLGYIQPATPRLSSTLVTATPAAPMSPTNNFNLVRTSTKTTTPFVSTLVLVQEKGALSTFKGVYHRLRAEWRLDALHTPDDGMMSPPMSGPSR